MLHIPNQTSASLSVKDINHSFFNGIALNVVYAYCSENLKK